MPSTMTRPQSARQPHSSSKGAGQGSATKNVSQSKGGGDLSSDPLQPDIRTPPLAVRNNPKKLAAWNDATEDERLIMAALYDLEHEQSSSEIERYLRFTQWWHARYPKGHKTNYMRGKEAVKNGAANSPYSVQYVYAILRTGRVYSLKAYQVLNQKATENGVQLKWTCLKTLACKLGKPEYNKIRQAVEREMVKTRMTEKQLIKLIGEYAPETVSRKETAQEQAKPAKVLKSFVSAMKRNVDKCRNLQDTIGHLDMAIGQDDPEEMKAELRDALDMFDQLARFIEENRPRLENSLKAVSFTTETESEKEENVRRIADSVKQRLQTDRQKDRPANKDRLTLAPGFNDEEQSYDRSPRMTFRDDGDEHEFGSLDDEFEDEWDDSDEDDPIYDEAGNIPAPSSRRR